MIPIDAFEAIRGRRSIRSFTDRPIPDNLIEQVIDAARWAPFGTRHDERAIMVLAGEQKQRVTDFLRERLEEVLPVIGDGPSRQVLTWARAMVPIVETAPVLVAMLTESEREGPELAISSAACAIQNMLIAAHAVGLASCYITGAIYFGDEITYLLGAPRHRLIGLVPLGYSAGGGRPRTEFPAVIWRGFEGKEQSRDDSGDDLPITEALDISSIPGARPGGGERVLVITERPDVDRWMVDLLEQAGYEVMAVHPAEALSRFETHKPHVTIVDAILGTMSGYEIARRIHDSVDGPCPVIVTTAAYDATDEQQALIAGASDVLTKPIRDYELLARVRALANSRALYGKLEQHADELERANCKLRELQQLRDNLTHMIVHDMRTPLTNIISGLQTVEATDYDDELSREFLPEAILAGQELADMISNLLDISKMEAGELEPELGHFEAGALVSEAFDRVGHLARQKQLELIMAVDGGVELNADRALMKRVLINLLSNAIKFTPLEGSVTVSAEARDGAVRVVVTDTGPGISAEEQKLLFRKFAQLESGKKHQGTGLGLAFVSLAVGAHGGTVGVESEAGEGSRFFFTIPDR